MAIVKERYAAWREAAYFEIAEAARLLGDLPSAQIREPALHFLATRQTGDQVDRRRPGHLEELSGLLKVC